MKIWVTKYALTDGVFVREGTHHADQNMAVVAWPGGLNDKGYFHGRDFQLSREEALVRVAEMIESKRASIKKQLSKLEDISRRVLSGDLPVAILERK